MEIINEYSRRFLEVVKEMKITDYYIWNNVDDISKGQMSQLRNGRGGASLTMIDAFCKKFPEVNSDYILTGRGSMFVESGNNFDEILENQKESNSHDEALLQILEKVLSEMKEIRNENKKLSQKVTDLENLIKMKKRA